MDSLNPRVLIQQAADDAMAKAKGDLPKATDYMEAAVRSDERIFRALMGPLVRDACYGHLRAIFRKTRSDANKHVWTAPNYTKGGNGQRLHALIETYLNFPLPQGPSLLVRNATREDLIAGAVWYEKPAKTTLHYARWLRAIAAKLPSGKVADKFTENQLHKLFEDTKE